MHRLKLLAAAALIVIGTAAQAHRFHAGITDVSFNARSGSTEIVHTFMTHDVEALLANLYQRQFDLNDPDDEAILRTYFNQQFWLQAPDKSRIALRWVGMTVDAQSVTIYQEAEATPIARIGAIHHGALADFLPDQVNTVNINSGGALRSLTFGRERPEQTLP